MFLLQATQRPRHNLGSLPAVCKPLTRPEFWRRNGCPAWILYNVCVCPYKELLRDLECLLCFVCSNRGPRCTVSQIWLTWRSVSWSPLHTAAS
jgi:hypothetical protein